MIRKRKNEDTACHKLRQIEQRQSSVERRLTRLEKEVRVYVRSAAGQ